MFSRGLERIQANIQGGIGQPNYQIHRGQLVAHATIKRVEHIGKSVRLLASRRPPPGRLPIPRCGFCLDKYVHGAKKRGRAHPAQDFYGPSLGSPISTQRNSRRRPRKLS
mgnify:CR=1 FL=1